MSKSQTTIILTFLLILTAFNGFLAWQWGAFRTEYNLLVAHNQSQGLESGKLAQRTEDLEKKLEEQRLAVEEFRQALKKLPDDLKADFDARFLRLPEYVTAKPLFAESQADGGTKAVGNLAELDAWQDRNKLFLEDIIQESVTLDYDSAKQGVAVTDIVSGSVYHQMGLRKGDIIKSVGIRQALSGDDVRVALMSFQPLTLGLQRDGAKIILDISYVNP